MSVIENCMRCGKLCKDGCCPCQWPVSMERIVCANCEELQRRLDRLKPKPPACAIDEPGGDEDEWIAWDEAMARYVAIAEGREVEG